MSLVRAAFVGCVVVFVGACSSGAVEDVGSSEAPLATRPGCEAVRCPMPLCAQGQHLAYQGSCCPTCVGPSERCATVLCAAVMCAQGEILVHNGPNDCCGHCVAAPAEKECTTDADCPQIMCIQCPCPVSSCQGRRCVTSTPDASTCGSL